MAGKKTKQGAVGTVEAVAEPAGPVAMPIGNGALSTPGRDTRFHPGDPGRPLGSRNKLAVARDVAGDLRSAIAKS